MFNKVFSNDIYDLSLFFFSSFIVHSLFLTVDPLGAQHKVLEIANSLGLNVSVAVAHEVSVTNIGIWIFQ